MGKNKSFKFRYNRSLTFKYQARFVSLHGENTRDLFKPDNNPSSYRIFKPALWVTKYKHTWLFLIIFLSRTSQHILWVVKERAPVTFTILLSFVWSDPFRTSFLNCMCWSTKHLSPTHILRTNVKNTPVAILWIT
jgi:predicted permease